MKLSVKKFSKKSLSLLIALVMIISAMPFSPLSSPFEANAATQYETTGLYDFTTSDSGANAIAGYVGADYVMKVKAWDSSPSTKSGNLDDLRADYPGIFRVTANVESSINYQGNTKNKVTPKLTGLYFHDAMLYISNVGSYLSDLGFEITWTQEYFAKDTQKTASGVFAFGKNNKGDIFKWSNNTNKISVENTSYDVAPTDRTIYEFTIKSTDDRRISLTIKNRTTSEVLNYTTTEQYNPTDLGYLIIGCCDTDTDHMGRSVIDTLTIKKAVQTSGGDESNTTTTTTINSFSNQVYCVSNHAASGNTDRYNTSGNGINICNDGASDNFNSGYFKLDISAIPEYITSLSGAKLSVNIPKVNKGALGVDFYATTTNLVDHKNSYTSSTGDQAREDVLSMYSNLVYLGSYVHIGNSTTAPGTITINEDISDVIKYMRSSGVNSMGIVAMPIGVGSAGTGDCWSYVWVKSVSIGTITTEDFKINGTPENLKKAITAYETKMQSGNVYTNMKEAYDTYVAANKAYDAYYYGNNTSVNLTTATQNLVKATNRMRLWTAHSATTFGSFAGDNKNDFTTYDPRNYYKNLVYSGRGTGDGTAVTTNNDYRARIHMGKTVAIYDGNEINIPVMASAIYDARSANVALWGIAVSSGVLTLSQKWKFQDTSTNFIYLINGGSGTQVPYTEATFAKTDLGDNVYKFGANILKYSGNPFGSGEYSKDITPGFTVGIGRTGSGTKVGNISLPSTTVDDYSPVYILNYKAAVDAINNNKSILKSISNYKEGGLTTTLSAFQKGTNLNLTLQNYTRNLTGSVDAVAEEIRATVEYISANRQVDTSSNYPALRSAMDYSGTLPNFVNVGDNTVFSVREAYNNGTNPGMFTDASYANFKAAYLNAQNTMKTVYGSGYKSGPNAKTYAEALKDAFNALKKYQEFTVNFIDSGLNTVKTINKTTNDSDLTIGEFPQNTSTVPTPGAESDTHNVYTWNTQYNANSEITSSFNIYETAQQVAHTFTNANHVVPTDPENNSYTEYTCTECSRLSDTVEYDDVSSDWEAYEAQLTKSQDEIANTAKYTSDSIKAVQDVIDSVASVKGSNTKSSGYIRSKISDLITKTNELDLNQYSITFNVFDEYGNSTETVIDAQSYDYGTLLNLQLPDTYQENAVSAWKRSIRGVDSVVGATSHSLQVMITGTTTYTAFVKKATTASEGQAVITLNNKSNKVYDIGYVENNKVVDVNVDVKNGTITIGGQKLTAPTYSFYKVKGFKINGNTVDTGTINITGDIVIKPEYEAISSFTITGGKGVVEKSTTTSWDQRVRLTAETPALSGKINKWTSTINGQNVVWGYGDTLSFQATQACTVECTEVDATEFNGVEDVKLSVDYVSYNLYRSNSITAISRVIAPEGSVVEYGTILKTANVKSGATNENYETQKLAVDNKDNYKVTNKSGVFKSTQMISNTNQFAYNFYSAQNYDKMYVGAVAYAKLSDGTYVYSDVVTYEFK